MDGTTPLDVAYVNANVWTGVTGGARENALGVVGERIAALGADAVKAASGPRTRTVDLGGAFVTPGLIDNHTHFLRSSQWLSQPDLRLVSSREELVSTIAEAARRQTPGVWVEGGNWDEQAWGGEMPTRHWIDAVTPDTPVAVARTDQHMLLLNSLALKLAGINRDTVAPEGGVIAKDEHGEPTGIVKDAAIKLVMRAKPKATDAQIEASLRDGIEYALGLGLTQIHLKELDWLTHHALKRMRPKGEPGVRFYSYVPIKDWQQAIVEVREQGRGDDWVRWGGLKALFDGSLGSRTALFHEPYTDAPDTCGITMFSTEELGEWIAEGDSHGMQVAVHAIGDRANDLALDMFAAAIERNGPRDRRFLIEHAQHVRPSQIKRFTELGVIPSMQPYHAVDDGRWAEKRIGPERLDGAWAFRKFLDAGARLSFGSDWPVATLDPLQGIEAAVMRETPDGANPGGWLPDEKLTVEEALHAYTTGNAYAGFQEDRLGAIAPGMLADFVALDRDLFAVDGAQISKAQVLLTVVGGRARFDRLS